MMFDIKTLACERKTIKSSHSFIFRRIYIKDKTKPVQSKIVYFFHINLKEASRYNETLKRNYAMLS